LRSLIDGGAEIDEADDYGRTPLSIAAEEGHEAVVRLLLEKGANVDKVTDKDCTPLYFAAAAGHEAVVRLLLEKGADVDKACNDDTPGFLWAIAPLMAHTGSTPLCAAAEMGQEAVVRLLLEKGANINKATTEDGSTPLRIATERAGFMALLLNNPGLPCLTIDVDTFLNPCVNFIFTMKSNQTKMMARRPCPLRMATKRWSGCCWRRVRTSTRWVMTARHHCISPL